MLKFVTPKILCSFSFLLFVFQHLLKRGKSPLKAGTGKVWILWVFSTIILPGILPHTHQAVLLRTILACSCHKRMYWLLYDGMKFFLPLSFSLKKNPEVFHRLFSWSFPPQWHNTLIKFIIYKAAKLPEFFSLIWDTKEMNTCEGEVPVSAPLKCF